MIFLCYKKCSTCAKAKDFLISRGISFSEREIKENPPTTDELLSWIDLSGLSINKFFNTSGLVYKSMNMKEKIDLLSNKEKIDLLSTDGMLVKRPILVTKNKVLVGFKEKEWSEVLEV